MPGSRRRSPSFAASSRSWSLPGRRRRRGGSSGAADVELPDADETAVPFVTIDPPDSMDLDQALHVERRGTGYRVRYAIADVAAFVAPGSLLDEEAHRRVQTLYAPDGNARLYPAALSEGAASLLPGELRPALVWTMDVDEAGEGTAVHVRKARVRSRAKLSYAGAQRALDDGSAEDVLVLLREVGILRQQREVRRGGVSLQLPSRRWRRARTGTTCPTVRRSRSRDGTPSLADDRHGARRS